MSSLQYPYGPTFDISLYDDPYKRPISRLFQSLINYGDNYRFSDSSLSLRQSTDFFSCNLFCGNPQSENDLSRFLELFPPTPIKTRSVLPVQVLNRDNAHVIQELRNVIECEQVLIVQCFPPSKWVILLVFLTQRTIEVYTMGEIDDLIVELTSDDKFGEIVLTLLPGDRFAINRRLDIPTNFDVNPIAMAFTMVHFLHRHGRYFNLSPEKVLKYQAVHLTEFIQAHDRWMGYLDINRLSSMAESIIVSVSNEETAIQEVTDLGWAIIDVLGDGNCGYYSLLLGLENTRDCTYTGANRATARSWKAKTLELRRLLQRQSRLLLTTEYPRGKRDQPFWEYSTAFGQGDEAIDALSSPFANDQFTEEQYFDEHFERNTDYHMDPTWAPHVFSFVYAIRVIVFTRETLYTFKENDAAKSKATKTKAKGTKANDKTRQIEISYSWSTRTFDYDNPVDLRDIVQPGIQRLSEHEYRSKPTIEILYTTGYKSPTKAEDNHFQFLRRVICHRVPVPRPPSTTTIRQTILRSVKQRQKKNQKRLHESGDQALTTVANDLAEAGVDSSIETNIQEPLTDTDNGLVNAGVEPADAGVDSSIETNIQQPLADTNNGLADAGVDFSIETNIQQPLADTGNNLADAGVDFSIETNIQQPLADTDNTYTEPNHCNKKRDCTSIALTTKVYTKKRYRRTYSKLKARQTAALTRLYRQHNERSTHDVNTTKLTATKMKYDPSTGEFYKKNWDDDRKDYTIPELIENIEDYNEDLVKSAISFEGEWMGPTVGDAFDSLPPVDITTNVPVTYQQLNKSYCLTYSLASALIYCELVDSAKWLYGCAPALSVMPFDQAIAELKLKMAALAPVIGQATIYGRKTKRHNRFKREMTWDNLFTELTPYPTLVIPVLPTGEMTHAFCVVDDLIFDSSVHCALRLQMDTVKWIFNGIEPSIFLALRFNTKISPPKGEGPKIKERYDRKVQTHW